MANTAQINIPACINGICDHFPCSYDIFSLCGFDLIKQKCLDPVTSFEMIQLIESLQLQYIILTTSQSCISMHHDELFEYYQQFNIDLDAIRTQYNLNEILPYALKIETMTHTPKERENIKEKAESLGLFVEIKETANEITLSVSEDGAAHALNILFHL